MKTTDVDTELVVAGPPPPFDPECVDALMAARAEFPEPYPPEVLPAMRIASDVYDPSDQSLEQAGYRVEHRTVPGPADNPDLAVIICTPVHAEGPVPALFHIHGGGMIMGTARSGLDTVVGYAPPDGMAIISVDYRVAPEHPYPAGLEDCFAALSWLVDSGDELGVDPQKIVVFGQSGGGCLAAAVTLLWRDRLRPALLGQLLPCPMLDDRNDTPSSVQMGESGFWIRSTNEMAWTAVLGDQKGAADVSPYASPARATDLSGLPPTFIDVGSAEIFRHEAVSYANAIWLAGGEAELHVWPGGYHGYDAFAPNAAITLATFRARKEWLRRILDRAGSEADSQP